MKVKLKVWVVFGDRVKLGDGRARLLELIDELGSIQPAIHEGIPAPMIHVLRLTMLQKAYRRGAGTLRGHPWHPIIH